jgi:hypothetical protein
MKNLNLSNEAADFLKSLEPQPATLLWRKIEALLNAIGQGDAIEFGDGRLFITLNEFIIIYKSDDETIQIDVIGRRFEAFSQAMPISAGSPIQVGGIAPPSAPSLNDNSLELFVLSFASLTFALTIQRWFTHDLSVFGALYFLPLIVCLAGTAIGIWNQSERLFRMVPVAFFLSVVVTIAIAGISGAIMHQPGALIIATILAVLAMPFSFCAFMGARIGHLFTRLSPPTGFGAILPALVLSYLTVALTSALSLPPSYQIAITALVLLVFPSQEFKPRLAAFGCLILAAVAMFIPWTDSTTSTTTFSPYHKVATHAQALTMRPPVTAVIDDTLQEFLPASETGTTDASTSAGRASFSRLPFAFKQPLSLLVLGSGIGVDVQEALKQKVESIDAVEIDPILLKVGRKFNDAYRSPSVRLHNEDPRCFLQNCGRKYDMIIISLADFVAPLGIGSGMQTREIYRKCISLLNPDGLLLSSFATPIYDDSQWWRDRFYVTIKDASGVSPLVIRKTKDSGDFSPYLFVTSKEGNIKENSQRLTSGLVDWQTVHMPDTVDAKPATDDCPYIYFRPGVSDSLFILCTLILIALVAWFGQSFIFSKSDLYVNWQVFFLNTGMVSMILGSLPRITAMYGSDWLCNAIIFGAILTMAWLTISSIRKSGVAQYELILYVGLFTSLLISYFLPVLGQITLAVASSFLSKQWLANLAPLSSLLIVFFTAVPLVRVLLILPAIFSEAKEPTTLLSFSILGVVAGLLLSHISYYFGQNMLLAISLIPFACSLLMCISGQKTLIPPVAKLATKRIT